MANELADGCIAGARSLAVFELLRQRLVQVVPVASPGAGLDWSLSVPAGVVWEPLAIAMRYSTSAVVANRRVVVLAQDDNGNTIWRDDSAASQAASNNTRYAYALGLGFTISGAGNVNGLPSPPIPMRGGFKLVSSTTSLDVGDSFSEIVVTVRAWAIHEALSNLDWIAGRLR